MSINPEYQFLLPKKLRDHQPFIVTDIHSIQRTNTAGEKGIYCIKIVVREFPDGAQLTANCDVSQFEQKIIQLPLVALHHVLVGTIWANGEKKHHIPCPLTEIELSNPVSFGLSGAVDLETSAVSAKNLVPLTGIQFGWECGLTLPDFSLKAHFLRFSTAEANLSKIYIPCAVLFRDVFYASDRLVKAILSGRAYGTSNELYYSENTKLLANGNFQIEPKGSPSDKEVFATARLIATETGRQSLELIRKSLVLQARSGEIFIRTEFPFPGQFTFSLTGRYMQGGGFLVTNLTCNGDDPVQGVEIMVSKRVRIKGAPKTKKPTTSKANPPRPPRNSKLSPNASDEGLSTQHSLAIKQSNLGKLWINKAPAFSKKTAAYWDDATAGLTRRMKPTDFANEYSAVNIGAWASGIPLGHQIPGSDALDNVDKAEEHFAKSAEEDFAKIISRLEGHGCTIITLPELDPATYAKMAEAMTNNDWLMLDEVESGVRRPRCIHAVEVVIKSGTYTGAKSLLLTFEPGSASFGVSSFFVVTPRNTDRFESVFRQLIRALADRRGDARSTKDFILSTVSDQGFANGVDEKRYTWQKLWGETWADHHAFKIFGHIKKCAAINGPLRGKGKLPDTSPGPLSPLAKPSEAAS